MSYDDPNLNPNDPAKRRMDVVQDRSDSGITWFIVGALVIAAGVLAYLYFGDRANTTAETGTTINAPADTGRASTPTAPAEPAAPSTPAPAAPASPPPADTAPAAPSAPAPANK